MFSHRYREQTYTGNEALGNVVEVSPLRRNSATGADLDSQKLKALRGSDMAGAALDGKLVRFGFPNEVFSDIELHLHHAFALIF